MMVSDAKKLLLVAECQCGRYIPYSAIRAHSKQSHTIKRKVYFCFKCCVIRVRKETVNWFLERHSDCEQNMDEEKLRPFFDREPSDWVALNKRQVGPLNSSQTEDDKENMKKAISTTVMEAPSTSKQSEAATKTESVAVVRSKDHRSSSLPPPPPPSSPPPPPPPPPAKGQSRVLARLNRQHQHSREEAISPIQSTIVKDLQLKMTQLRRWCEGETQRRTEAEKKVEGFHELKEKNLALERHLEHLVQDRLKIRKSTRGIEVETGRIRGELEAARAEIARLQEVERVNWREVHIPYRGERISSLPALIVTDLAAEYECYEDPASGMNCLHVEMEIQGSLLRWVVRGNKRIRRMGPSNSCSGQKRPRLDTFR